MAITETYIEPHTAALTPEAQAAYDQIVPATNRLCVLGPESKERSEIYSTVRRTPLVEVPGLVKGDQTVTLVKDEGIQSVGSHKIRGAFAAVQAARHRNPLLNTVSANSAGNHGQGVALAAQRLGIPTVYIETFEGASPVKLLAMEGLGAKVRLHANLEIAEKAARKIELLPNSAFIAPFDSADTIAGQSTLMSEIAADLRWQASQGTIEERDEIIITVPGGGGGTAAGMAVQLYNLKQQGILPWNVQLHVTQVEGSDAIYQARNGGKMGKLNPMCDGTAVKQPGQLPMAVIRDRQLVDSVDRVTEAGLGEAMMSLQRVLGHDIEPAGGLSLAGARHLQENLPPPPPGTKRVFVTLATGANVSLRTRNYFRDAAYAARRPAAEARFLAFKRLSDAYSERTRAGVDEINGRPARAMGGLAIWNGHFPRF